MGKSWKDGKNRDKKWEKFGKKKGGKPRRFEDNDSGKRTWTEYDGDGDYRTNKASGY